MWIGSIEDLKKCSFLLDAAKAQITEFFNNNNIKLLSNGRYDLGAGNYVNIFEYETEESDGVFETHKAYIDIHYAILGSEKILWAEQYEKELTPYQADGDYSLGTVESAKAIEPNGRFCLFLPGEPHKAGVVFNAPQKVKKAVFKILI